MIQKAMRPELYFCITVKLYFILVFVLTLSDTNKPFNSSVVHSIDIQCNGSEDAIVNCNVTQLQFCPMADDGHITVMCQTVETEPTGE